MSPTSYRTAPPRVDNLHYTGVRGAVKGPREPCAGPSPAPGRPLFVPYPSRGAVMVNRDLRGARIQQADRTKGSVHQQAAGVPARRHGRSNDLVPELRHPGRAVADVDRSVDGQDTPDGNLCGSAGFDHLPTDKRLVDPPRDQQPEDGRGDIPTEGRPRHARVHEIVPRAAEYDGLESVECGNPIGGVDPSIEGPGLQNQVTGLPSVRGGQNVVVAEDQVVTGAFLSCGSTANRLFQSAAAAGGF